jgi:phosphatidylserine synthase
MALYGVAGALRLSRYAVTGTVNGYYEGVPVTFGLTIPVAFWVCQFLDLPTGWLPLLYAAGAFLMVSTIRVKKP